ncbi:hypothetical protein ABZ891_35815 [Streptomyces sp. NPDC047023]|uniref:hypothetical protein n=1 Tax=Streptomyces sp. NPDC047023 TaxID=3155139 RepID=UPI003411A1DB
MNVPANLRRGNAHPVLERVDAERPGSWHGWARGAAGWRVGFMWNNISGQFGPSGRD